MSKEIMRWIVRIDECGYISIEERLVSPYMPINRMLENVGFYDYEFIDLKDHLYYYSYDSSQSKRTVAMVGRFDKTISGLKMVDIGNEDKLFLDKIYYEIFDD